MIGHIYKTQVYEVFFVTATPEIFDSVTPLFRCQEIYWCKKKWSLHRSGPALLV